MNKTMNKSMDQLVGAFAHMIEAGIKNMAAGKEAIPVEVIKATGTTRLRPDTCEPHRAWLEYGYCDPYFGWLTPAVEEATLIIETAVMDEETAVRLWENGWTRAFLVELYERNDEKWEIGEDAEPELYDKLGFNVRTRRGFIDWILSGEIYGYNLPGHQAIMKTKEDLLLRNRRRKKASGD